MIQNVNDTTLTFTQQRIVEASERGYFITEEGHLFGPKGKLSIKKYGKQKYPTFSTNWGKRVYGLPIHQFAAYIFYGEESFNKSLVVRHLNADTSDCSKTNIVLGTHSQNNLDKPKEVRISAAKKARASQVIVPTNAKLTEEQVREIRNIYKTISGKAPNGFRKNLAEKYKVSGITIHNVVKGGYYASFVH